MAEEGNQTIGRVSAMWTWGPPAAAAAIIFILSTVPGQRLPEHPDLVSTLVHLLEFGILSYLLARAIRISALARGRLRIVMWTVLICMAYGFLDEARQFLVPNRVFDLMDILADTAGSLGGAVLFLIRANGMGGGTA